MTGLVYSPDTPSQAATYMRDRLQELRIVWAGTEGFAAHTEVYLPKFEKETDPNYRRRKANARVRRNMFRQAVERVTGRIFEVPVRLKEASDFGKVFADDADMRGNSLDRIARNFYRDGLKLGIKHILIDYPVVNARNLAEERKLKARPYLIEIDPEQVLRCFENGDGFITHLAWQRVTVEWDESLGQETDVHYIEERFAVPGQDSYRKRTWKRIATIKSALPGEARPVMLGGIPSIAGKAQSYTWALDGEEQTVTAPRIMFHTLYAEEEGFMIGRTPLTEVKDLTIEHYQLASDYRQCLKNVLFAILVATGVDPKQMGDVVLGPDSILGSSDPNADFKYLEHNGKALEAGYKDLESLEQRAEAYAGRLTKATGDVKATTEAINSAEVSSFAKDMAMSLQDKLQAICDDVAIWADAETIGTVEVNMDFAVDLPDGDLTVLQSARSSGDLSRETLWTELTRRNILSRDFDPDEEAKRLDEQEAESMKREQEAMRFASSLKEQTGSGAPFPPKEEV